MATFKKQDVVSTIKNFIGRYFMESPKVEWPQWEFAIKDIESVETEEESLKNFGERWTFEGTAVIRKTDARNTVSTKSNCRIIGSAVVDYYQNDWNQNELLSEVKQVTITKIEEQ